MVAGLRVRTNVTLEEEEAKNEILDEESISDSEQWVDLDKELKQKHPIGLEYEPQLLTESKVTLT